MGFDWQFGSPLIMWGVNCGCCWIVMASWPVVHMCVCSRGWVVEWWGMEDDWRARMMEFWEGMVSWRGLGSDKKAEKWIFWAKPTLFTMISANPLKSLPKLTPSAITPFTTLPPTYRPQTKIWNEATFRTTDSASITNSIIPNTITPTTSIRIYQPRQSLQLNPTVPWDSWLLTTMRRENSGPIIALW